MANVGNVLIVNRLAPVRVYTRKGTGEVGDTTRDFKNLAEFENWYRPSYHGPSGVNSHYLFTDVLLDTLADPPSHLRERKAKPEGGATAPRAAGRHQKVEVDGTKYNSTWAAFQALAIGDVKECVKFRTELKAKKELAYKGKMFKIVEE